MFLSRSNLSKFDQEMMLLMDLNRTYNGFKAHLSNDTQSFEQNVQGAQELLGDMIAQQQHHLNRMKKMLSYESKQIRSLTTK